MYNQSHRYQGAPITVEEPFETAYENRERYEVFLTSSELGTDWDVLLAPCTGITVTIDPSGTVSQRAKAEDVAAGCG